MRTTKNQKITNYIIEAAPQYAESFESIVQIQDIYYNGQKAMTVTFSTFINDEKTTTTCKGMVIKEYDLVSHHKGTLPYNYFYEDKFGF